MAGLNPGTNALVKGDTKIKDIMHTDKINKKEKFKIVLAVRMAFILSLTKSSLKTGIKATESVPKISRLKIKSGILKAA